jgi:hypothetical protein
MGMVRRPSPHPTPPGREVPQPTVGSGDRVAATAAVLYGW